MHVSLHNINLFIMVDMIALCIRLCQECQTLIENHDQIKLLSNARNNLNTTLKVGEFCLMFIMFLVTTILCVWTCNVYNTWGLYYFLVMFLFLSFVVSKAASVQMQPLYNASYKGKLFDRESLTRVNNNWVNKTFPRICQVICQSLIKKVVFYKGPNINKWNIDVQILASLTLTFKVNVKHCTRRWQFINDDFVKNAFKNKVQI